MKGLGFIQGFRYRGGDLPSRACANNEGLPPPPPPPLHFAIPTVAG